jgi:DNA polymerase-1
VNEIEDYIYKAELLAQKCKEDLYSFKELKSFIYNYNKYQVQEEVNKINLEIQERKSKLLEKNINKDVENDFVIVRKKTKIGELMSNSVNLYTDINFISPKQVQQLLYSKMGFGFPSFDGKYSTDAESVSYIDHPFIEKFRAYKTVSRVLSNYLISLKDKEICGRIYGNFNQAGTKTGRISSSNPNLQNMITRINYKNDEVLEVVKLVKKLFVPPKDHYILQTDLSQAELRMIAHYSEDPMMIKAYKENIDLHSVTGAKIRNVTLDEFTKLETFKEDRFMSKSANFGWTFGSSIAGYIRYVKKQIGLLITENTAQNHKDAIFKTYVKLNVWHEKYKRIFKSVGTVETLFGRKRYLSEYWNKGDAEYASGERMAINTPIQGSSGEWTLFSIVLLWFRLPKEVQIFNTVHDSTLKYTPKNLLERTKEITKETFENLPTQHYFNFTLKVPMKVEFEYSDISWGDCE